MKTIDPALLALFASVGGEIELPSVDLYTITPLGGGTPVRWSGADISIDWGGNTYDRNPLLTRGSVKEKRGIEVSSLSLIVQCNETNLINGVPIIPFARGGGFDGASLKYDRLFGSAWGTWVGTVTRFSGRIGPVRNATRDGFEFNVNSWSELLNADMPPNVVQATCLHSVFDTGCGLVAASFAQAKTVQASPAPTTSTFQIVNTSPVRAAEHWALGKALFTSGANSGLTRSIRSFTSGGLVTLTVPLPVAPASGDGVTLTPGCDLLQATCSGKFSNLSKFKAMPYVPVPETGV